MIKNPKRLDLEEKPARDRKGRYPAISRLNSAKCVKRKIIKR